MVTLVPIGQRGLAERAPRWPLSVNKQSPQAAGLVGWWSGLPPDGGVFRSSLLEASNHAAYTSAVPGVTPFSGWGLATTADTQHATATLTAAQQPGTALSVMCWWVPSATENVFAVLMDNRNGANTQGWALLRNGADKIRFRTPQLSNANLDGSANIEEGVVTFFAATWDGATKRTYHYNLNGLREVTEVAATGTITHAATLRLKNTLVSTVNLAPTNVAWDFRVYNRGLSKAVVDHIFDPVTRWDLYSPRRTFVFVPAAAVGANELSGAPSTQPADASGTMAAVASASGTPSATTATADGVMQHVSPVAGAPQAAAATSDGTLQALIQLGGTSTAEPATSAGTLTALVSMAGAAAAERATSAGAAGVVVSMSGAVQASTAEVFGGRMDDGTSQPLDGFFGSDEWWI